MVSVDTKIGAKRIAQIRKALGPEQTGKAMYKAAREMQRDLISRTPKKWTGNTRRGWRIQKRSNGRYTVYNRTKTMGFLERGTKAHGPKRAKRLFIPLTRKASLYGARGVMAANASAEGGAKPFKFGRDFVLAKRVKGIKAMHIVKNFRPQAKGYAEKHAHRMVQRASKK